MECIIRKRTVGDPVVYDCKNSKSICKTVCCTKRFALVPEDLDNGFKVDLKRPFLNKMETDGYCHAFDRVKLQCSMWDVRPMSCKVHDCRKVTWDDFDKKILKIRR